MQVAPACPTEKLPQFRNVHLDCVWGSLGRLVTPHRLRQAVTRHGPVGFQQQGPEDRPVHTPADRKRPPPGLEHLERTEN